MVWSVCTADWLQQGVFATKPTTCDLTCSLFEWKKVEYYKHVLFSLVENIGVCALWCGLHLQSSGKHSNEPASNSGKKRRMVELNEHLPCQPVGTGSQSPRWRGCLWLAGRILWARPSCLLRERATSESLPCRLEDCRNPEGKRGDKENVIGLLGEASSSLILLTCNDSSSQQTGSTRQTYCKCESRCVTRSYLI